MYALHDTRSPSRSFCVSVALAVTQIHLHLAVQILSIESCYPCQALSLENLLSWPSLTRNSLLLHPSPTNLPVTCCHPVTYHPPTWRFAPDDILFFGLSLLGKRFFAFRFQNHPPYPQPCVHLGINLELGSKKSCSELGYGTLEGGEELPTGCARSPPSELQTTPGPGPWSRRGCCALQDCPSFLRHVVTLTVN